MTAESFTVGLVLCLAGVVLAYVLRDRRPVSSARAVLLRRRPVIRRSAQTGMQLLRKGQALIQEKEWTEALSAFDQALEVLQADSVLMSDLHFHRGQALEKLRRYDEAIAAYVASQLADSDSAPPRHAHVAAFRQGHLLAQLGRWQEAELSLRTCTEACVRIDQFGVRLSALRALLGVYQAMRQHAQALQCAREVERLARQEFDEPLQALALDVEGDIYLALGDPIQALHRYEQSLDLFRKHGNMSAEAVVKRDIARLYRTSGQWDKAFRWLGVRLEEEQRAGDWAEVARITYDLGCMYIHAGDLVQAGGYLQHSLALFRQAEDRPGAEAAGRTLMGLSILMHRQATAGWLTFGDIERGSAHSNEDDEE